MDSSPTLNEKGLALIFGPQDPNISPAIAKELRSLLLDTPSFEWVVDTLVQLEIDWPDVANAHQELESFEGLKHLQLLTQWIRKGSLTNNLFPLPNILVTPLVVTLQLTQYIRFLTILNPKITSKERIRDTLQYDTETVGLCTGLLTSAAVASSATLEELQRYGAVAIRTAMAIGALVDVGDATRGEDLKWQSLAVGWTSQGAEDALSKIMEQFEDAYISVISESRLATITAPKVDATALFQQLRNAGIVFTETALRGPFHCSSRESQAASLLEFFDSEPAFQFADASKLAIPTRAVDGSKFYADDKLHRTASRAMLTDRADWHKLFTEIHSSVSSNLSTVVAFGSQRFVPQWFARKLDSQLAYAMEIQPESGKCPFPLYSLVDSTQDDDIAVVGMACHLPGGSDVQEFWDSLCAGKSQHSEVPVNRVDFEHSAFRHNNPKKKWYGNFVRDHDAFDHKFFKKSPREMVSTDPQHRLILQVAYQATEQSGYFNKPGASRNVGCYVGIGVADHEDNVACHDATAYTATGNLKAFAAGKISHFFGWSGPSLTIDTACSSSALAVHHACKAILNGECNAAIAGGTSIMTNPEWYQNLDGASFLSPSGQCKPFDEAADGYCRGEGAGAVFLKTRSAAIKDGDQILGVIRASCVNQNENCSAITAPSVTSLSSVFSSVIRKAQLDPKQISVVEAHGTGTQVGDKAEYESVRNVLGGPSRAKPLTLGSVKGLIGHLECASGIAGLIKLLLMIYHGSIPPQPSFQRISSKLNASLSDKIEISKGLGAWETGFRAALLNNYGASGSNASLVVTQDILAHSLHAATSLGDGSISQRPFWLSGLDERALKAYSLKLAEFIRLGKGTDTRFTIDNLSFQLERQSNRSLGQALVFGSSSIEELQEKLEGFANGRSDLSALTRSESARPVILCFGGQRSNFIGLDREAYTNFKSLRAHLDDCHEICLSLGLDGIFPAIFERTPRSSIVELQTMQFALQYSCAKSWMESGVQVAALVGHSFGELTAMCVSGMLPVKDTLKMIAIRARLIEEKWGSDSGSMMAVDGELDIVEELLRQTNEANSGEPPVNIACFNGPRSFTLAGASKSMEALRETISASQKWNSIKTKALDVTHAFHSCLADSIVPELEKLGDELIFRDPTIPLERATKSPTAGPVSAKVFASHMRDPVHFHSAVERLASKYPSSIWLEVGSGAGITTMASRAVGSKNMTFQAINLMSSGAVQNMTDATLNLWKAGLNTTFWGHCNKASEYPVLLLPPYQFEKSRHWLERRTLEPKVVAAAPQLQAPATGLWTFLSYTNESSTHARFQVNTTSHEFKEYVSAHIIVQTAPICPSMLQQVIARDALQSLVQDQELIPELQDMESDAPLCIDESKLVWLDAHKIESEPFAWDFSVTSTDRSGASPKPTQHVSGRVYFRTVRDSAQTFAKYERLADRRRALTLLDGQEADQVIQGSRNIYKAFADVVQYNNDDYRGLKKIVSVGNESAGRILKQDKKGSILSVGLGDTFCQVAGIFLNCMTDCEAGKMYLSNRVEQWIRSPTVGVDVRPSQWDVYARHHQPSPKEYVSDLFVFDSTDGKLVWVILGLHFVEVSIAGMSRLLTRVPGSAPAVPIAAPVEIVAKPAPKPISAPKPAKKAPVVKKAPSIDILSGVRKLFCTLLGLEREDIQLGSDLVELGIDSLLAMEVAREVEKEFSIKFELEELMDMSDVRSLVNCIQVNLGASDSSGVDENSSEDDEDLLADEADQQTPEVAALGIPPTRQINADSIINTFAKSRKLTDEFIKKCDLAGYSNNVNPRLTELVVVHTLDAFVQFDCDLRAAKAGEIFPRINHPPRHNKVVDVLYGLLEKARIVDIQGSTFTRTAVPTPSKSAAVLLQELLRDYPEHYYDHKLTSLTGVKLGECLSGKMEGIHMLFGSAEGRELASGMYAKSPINVAWLHQLQHFWDNWLVSLPQQHEPINILEIGAGTGGTTSGLLPLLARSGIPCCYTATDISPSLVAGLRKRFKSYPWMRFEVIDIEKAPPSKLLQSQHVVLATNCVHATHSLAVTTKNIHRVLRPDGFLIMLEMTEALPWVDSVFGLVEGWWLFDDGRQHALAQPEHWQKVLHANGYGHVDWSDGNLPENSIQRVIIALASGQQQQRVSIPPPSLPVNPTADSASRQVVIDTLVKKHIKGFSPLEGPGFSAPLELTGDSRRCVLVTGATGSLGSHLVAHFASQPDVHRVICFNRLSTSDSNTRQHEALTSRGLMLEPHALSKLEIIETNSSANKLGLSASAYDRLANTVTDVVHNAWAMSMTRPTNGFEPQFKTMRNLIDLCRESASRRPAGSRQMGFQFVSSVSVVGCHPFLTGEALVPEQRVDADSALPMGYADAKLICERMLDETLHEHRDRFRVMAVRVGQISGSRLNGFWNPVEHLIHLIKSSQTLGVLPDLTGMLSWCPVNDVAATLGELLLGQQPSYPIYHIENPVRQPWPEMITMLSDALNISKANIIPYVQWLQRVRQFPPSLISQNPAALLSEFFETDFIRMSCGGMILDTARSREHAITLRSLGPIDQNLLQMYIRGWKEVGFLY